MVVCRSALKVKMASCDKAVFPIAAQIAAQTGALPRARRHGQYAAGRSVRSYVPFCLAGY